MARAETLEILGDIVDQLEPVGDARRGMPLRAADWNTVVEAVSDLAKLVASRERTAEEQLEQGFASAGHDHEGAATLTWFEPQTRRLLEAAASGSVDQRLGQDKVEREIAALRGDIADVRKEMDQLRISIDGLRDSDFARERSLGQIGNDVETLKTLEGGLDNLAERFTGIRGDIAAALTFRDQLTGSTGEPIDVSVLVERVTDLEGLRENLLTADGEVVRIRELSSAIARLEEGSITRAEADGLIVDRVRDADLFSEAGLLEDITVRVGETLDPRFAAIDTTTTDLRAELDTLNASVVPISGRIDAMDDRLAGQDLRLDDLDTLGTRFDDMSARIGTVEIDLRAAQTVLADLPALNQSLSTLSAQVDGLEGLTEQVDANIAEIGRLGEQTTALEAATVNLPELSDRITTLERDTLLIGSLDTRLTGVEGLVSDFETRIVTNEAELDTLDGVTARLTQLDSTTTELTAWRQTTESRLTQLATGTNDNILIARLDSLEERVADQNVSMTRLEQSIAPLRNLESSINTVEGRLRTLERGGNLGGRDSRTFSPRSPTRPR